MRRALLLASTFLTVAVAAHAQCVPGARNPSQTPFASNSIFNLPLGSGAQWQSNGQLSSANVSINTVGNFNENIWIGTASDPLVTVTNNAGSGGTPGTFQVHIPVGAVPAGGTDQTFSVDDTATGIWYSFGGFNWTGPNSATVSQGSGESDTGSGMQVANSNWDEGVGTLRASDLQAGTIDHMLRIELPTDMLLSYSSGTNRLCPYCWPQTTEDGFAVSGSGGSAYSGSVPYGATIGIPAGTPEPADVKANQGADLLWHALQDHGAMIRDSGGAGNTVIFQADQTVDPNNPLIQGMQQFGAAIMAAAAILTNQGPNSVNGGGTPIVPLDAAPSDAAGAAGCIVTASTSASQAGASQTNGDQTGGSQVVAEGGTAGQASIDGGTDQAGLTVAEVAALAAQGDIATGQSIGSVEALASSAGTGDTLPTDPTTAAVLSGTAADAQPIVRAVASPGGMMPTPAAVSGSVPVAVAGDYTTTAVGGGNGAGTISGTGNVVTATGGAETLTVTGPGNALTLGDYNDVVTVQSAGNTIDTGGGQDTVILTYNGRQPSNVINADAAAVSPLASAGNIIVAPAPGTGTLTIEGTLAANDTIDLTKALAGTTWDHQPSSLWHYVTAQASASGCQIIVGGQVVVSLPNGSPGGNIGPFIAAH
jgi:hypothetical protein